MNPLHDYRALLEPLWRGGPLSRWELHERTGWSPNAVGTAAAELIEAGVLRACRSRTSSGGRPRIPLEIDPERRHVLGVSISFHEIQACRLNLRGQVQGEILSFPVADSEGLVAAAQQLVGELFNGDTLAMGLSATCFVDPRSQRLLLGSVSQGHAQLSLERLYEQVRSIPLFLENDMHALGARWSLTHQAALDEDVLLVYFRDGSLGAAMLVNGQPNRGCAVSANELGHMRLAVETERCFCGHTGCLERIVSSDFLRRHGAGQDATLAKLAADFDGSDAAISAMLGYLATGLGNAVNFMRPHRLVLVSGLMRQEAFARDLLRRTREQMLAELRDLVQVETWDQPATELAETAGFLALANFYSDGWEKSPASVSPHGAAKAPAQRLRISAR